MLLLIVLNMLVPANPNGLYEANAYRHNNQYPISITRTHRPDVHTTLLYSNPYKPGEATWKGILVKVDAFTYRHTYSGMIQSDSQKTVTYLENWYYNPLTRTFDSGNEKIFIGRKNGF